MGLSESERMVADYLQANEYASVEEWALDSDYTYDDDHDVWYDDERNCVDIESKIVDAIDSSVIDCGAV